MVANRLIDEQYFTGQLFLPGLGGRIQTERLGIVIDERQEEFLDKALGYALSAAFQQGILALPVDQRWLDLLNGKTYQDAYGITRKWVGFQNEQHKSPLANYVYYWLTRENATMTTTTGEAKPDKENAGNVSYAAKEARAWNDMVTMLQGLNAFLEVSNSQDVPVYPEWDVIGHHHHHFLPDIFSRINEFNF